MFFGTLTPLYSFDVVLIPTKFTWKRVVSALFFTLSEDDDVNKIVEMHVGSISN